MEPHHLIVDDIDAEVGQLSLLVDDLLLLARSDSGAAPMDRMRLDLGDIASDAASSLGRLAEGRGVRIEVDPEPAILDGDPVRLRQLVTILVDNAIRYTQRGGHVTTRVRREGEEVLVETDAFEARALQHELDHLDGFVFLDRVVGPHAVFARKTYL